MIFPIPIEPYEERYTEQWMRWWPKAFIHSGIPYKAIVPKTLTSRIERGSVLDAIGTNYTKAVQLAEIIKMIHEKEIVSGDILFFHDLWFPGIEALAYIRNMTGIDFKITGILHAGSYDQNDFTFINGMEPWANHIERGWLEFADAVFFATSYHAEMVVRMRGDCKWHVTGLPFNVGEVVRPAVKENIVVFPHRKDLEKQPDEFKTLALDLERTGWRFVFSVDECNTKDEYYELLGRSKIAVSCAKQETFGYAMLEAMANGC